MSCQFNLCKLRVKWHLLFVTVLEGNAVTEMESDRRVTDSYKMHYYVLYLRIRVKA